MGWYCFTRTFIFFWTHKYDVQFLPNTSACLLTKDNRVYYVCLSFIVNKNMWEAIFLIANCVYFPFALLTCHKNYFWCYLTSLGIIFCNPSKFLLIRRVCALYEPPKKKKKVRMMRNPGLALALHSSGSLRPEFWLANISPSPSRLSILNFNLYFLNTLILL